MTTLQKAVVGATLATAIAIGLYEALLVSRLREEIRTLQQQQAPLTEQIQELQREREDTKSRLEAVAAERQKNNTNNLELMKLRGDIARLRATSTQKPSTPQLSTSEAADVAAFEQMVRTTKAATSEFALEGLLSQIKRRLNLTQEQEASIREILKQDPMPKLNRRKPELQALLTPDQQLAFEQFGREIQDDKERLKVHQAVLDMLINLQSNVGLNSEQQDKAYSTLLDYGKQKVMYEAEPTEPVEASLVINAEEDLSHLTLNALQGVLTDEQMAIYRKYEEEMLKAKQFRFPSDKK